MTVTNDEVKNGNSWTSVRYFASFEEADSMRKSLKVQDRAGMMQIKVKRCGVGGTMFVVKTRTNTAALAELQEIEDKMMNKKKSKKQ